MRAFMSKPGDGPLYYDGETLAYADGTTFRDPYAMDEDAIRLATFAADVEVRRILAETEPWVWLPCHGLHERTQDARLALAEALAAFVAEGE